MTPRGQISPISEGSTLKEYFYAWGTFANDCAELAQQIEAAGGVPDVIVGIARGGWFVAAQLAFLLKPSQPKVHPDLKSLQLASYGDGDQIRPVLLLDSEGVGEILDTANVLLVDDVCDTGKTLQQAQTLLYEAGASAAYLRTAVLMYKPTKSTTGFVPDFWIHKTDRWIIYPWEVAKWPAGS